MLCKQQQEDLLLELIASFDSFYNALKLLLVSVGGMD